MQILITLVAFFCGLGLLIFLLKKLSIKKKLPTKKKLLTFVLIFILTVCIVMGLSSRYNWDDVYLNTSLPEPKSKVGDVQTNSLEDLYMIVEKTSYEDFEEYVKACIDKGFNIDVENNSGEFNAFSKDCLRICVDYYEYDKAMHIDVEALIIESVDWKDIKLATLLPNPMSTKGDIYNNHDQGCEVYLGEFTHEKYLEYVKKCKQMGYTKDAVEQDNGYFAKDKEGYELTLEYYGCGVIYIDLNVPDKEKKEKKEDESNTTEESSSENEISNSTDKSSEEDEQVQDSQQDSVQSLTRYCYATGCTKEGTKSYMGISGKEYYCETHYNEMMDIIGEMEKDVADSSYSKHTCEVCSKEGTYSIIGISGLTEYYCSSHYYEMKDIVDSLN